MRKAIREILTEIFNESVIKKHVWDRYEDRILPEKIDVGVELVPTNDGKGVVIVGKSSITADKKELIKQRIYDVQKVNFRKGKTYGVKLLDLLVNPNDVEFESEEAKKVAKGRTLVYVVSDAFGHSIGNQVWVVTDDENNVPSLMFRRTYVPPKDKYDYVIKDFDRILSKKPL